MMPPMWKSGIMFRQTSAGVRFHEDTMQATPTTIMSRLYGTYTQQQEKHNNNNDQGYRETISGLT